MAQAARTLHTRTRVKTGVNTTQSTVRFARLESGQAIQEMKTRVAEYFASRGLSSKANARMVLKSCLLLALTFVPYGLILSNRFSPWAMLVLAVIMGVGMAGIGFGISHDALHGAYTSNPR